MTVTFDPDRAALVVQRVHDAFRSGLGLLSETGDLVENQTPKGVRRGSATHGRFLFYVIPSDHGTKSAALYERAKALFLDHPALFEADHVVETFVDGDDPALVSMTGAALAARYPREVARGWYQNSKRLIDDYGGDVRRMFRSSSSAPRLLKTIREFRGYGPKTGGMLLRALVGLELAQVVGLDETLVPVDIHDSRIAFTTGMIRGGVIKAERSYYDFVRPVQQLLLETCNRLGLPWLDADRGLWLIGSRGCVKRRCAECPLHDVCSVGRAVVGQANDAVPQ